MTGFDQAKYTPSTPESMLPDSILNAGERPVEKVDSEPIEETSSIWRDAYENPGKTALIVGGVALAAGALIYSRGAVAKFLGRGKEEVLLFEDSAYFGSAIKKSLERQGSKVTWMTGLKDVKAGVGIAPDGHAVPLNFKHFKSAFVDGDLTDGLAGADVVSRLSMEKIMSVGISSQKSMNLAMRESGAIAAGNKGHVYGALFNRDLKLSSVIKEPGTVQARIDDYAARYHADSSIAKKAEALLKKEISKLGSG